jgi:Fe-S cluster assembly iron-binding protein IscA
MDGRITSLGSAIRAIVASSGCSGSGCTFATTASAPEKRPAAAAIAVRAESDPS